MLKIQSPVKLHQPLLVLWKSITDTPIRPLRPLITINRRHLTFPMRTMIILHNLRLTPRMPLLRHITNVLSLHPLLLHLHHYRTSDHQLLVPTHGTHLGGQVLPFKDVVSV